MKVTLKQIGKDAHFLGTNEEGHSLELHSPIIEGAEKIAPGPMESLLMAAAGCTAVDVLMILEKMKQPVEHLEIDVEGERVPTKSAKPYRAIDFTYKITGDVDQKKAERAVKLAVEKYCSVLESLHSDINLTWRVEIN